MENKVNIRYSSLKNLPREQVQALYESVQWSAYTKDMPKLMRGIENSQIVITAWNEEELTGLIRCLTDFETIAYIQDILVKPAYRKQGIDDELMRQTLAKLTGIRQIVLMTEDGDAVKGLHAWYQSHGFQAYSDLGTAGFAIFTA